MIQHQKISMHKRQFRIGDLAKELNLKKFIIRFWEKEFDLKSDRSSGGQRFYTQDDLNLFLTIKDLLYSQGFTISGAKKQLQQMKSGEVFRSTAQLTHQEIADLSQAAESVDSTFDCMANQETEKEFSTQVTEGAFVDQQIDDTIVEAVPFSAQPAEIDREVLDPKSAEIQDFFNKLHQFKAQIQRLDDLLD